MSVLLALVLVPAALSAVAYFVRRRERRSACLLLAALFHTGLTASFWRAPAAPGLGGWLGIDALGLLVLSAVSLLFLVVSVYAVGHLGVERPRGGRVFVSCLLAFLAAATVVTLAQHLALLWIGMESTTLALAPLVFHRHDRRSLEAVWKYLVLSSVGIALALLGTFVLAAAQTQGQPLILADLLGSAGSLHPDLLRAAFVFLLVGYGTKMGLAPLHSWKPDTYGEAPGLVAALMAGGLTSCAFLGLARVTAVMLAAGQGDFIRPPLLAFGLASMLVGAGLMLGQVDLKRLLAYSSVEHMGILAIALGLGGAGTYGAALHVVNNGVTKVLLFLTVANLVLWFGSADTTRLRAVLRRAPVSGSVLVLGLFAVTGSPPFGLFVSEFAILGAALQQRQLWLALAMLLLLAVVFVGMAGAILAVVHREPGAPDERVRESPWLVGGTVFLTALALFLGLYLPMPLRTLLADAARTLSGGAP